MVATAIRGGITCDAPTLFSHAEYIFMTLNYLIKRVGLFFLTVWVASTLNFLIPRLSPGDPVAGVLGAMQSQGATVANSAEIIQSFRARFGLDEPLHVQYVKYLWELV